MSLAKPSGGKSLAKVTKTVIVVLSKQDSNTYNQKDLREGACGQVLRLKDSFRLFDQIFLKRREQFLEFETV